MICIEERNRDFMFEVQRQRRRLYETADAGLTIEAVLRRVVESAAPAYYVDYEYARRHVGELLRGRKEAASRSRRRRMLEEIAAKCVAEMERGRGLTLGNALARVLATERASSFFLSYAQARKIYFELSRAEHRRTGRLRGRRLL